MSVCELYCPNVIVFLAGGGGVAPGAVNIHYFVWKLLSAIYNSLTWRKTPAD